MTSQIQRVRGLAFDETQDPARTRPQPTPETHHCTSSTNLLPAMNSTDCELSLQSSHFSHYSHSSGDFLDPEEEEVAPHLSSIEATATPYALPSNLSTHRHKRRRATPFKCNKENQCERQTDSSGGTSRNASDDAIQGISLFQKGGRPRNPKSSRQDRWAPMDLTQLEPWKSIRQLDPLAQIEYYWAHLYGNDSHEAFGDTSNSMAGCSGAWSAQRLPPTEGCLVNSADDLSKRPQVENTTAARTETNYDTPLRNGFQSLRYTTPKSSPDDKPKRTVSHNRKVQFGSIQAVVYYVDDPPPVWTEIPEDEASRKYSLDPPEPDNNAEELTQETKDNAAVLAEWDDDWDNVAVFEDAKDDEEELMFSLPAPPSRKTNRRRSSIFSPSGTAINLLECLPEQVEYPENKVVSESPEQALIDSPEMLGLQGLTNLSVQSPPVVEIAECTHSSPEDDSGSPSDLMKSFNKSPNDVRDVRETAVCLANLKRPVFWIRQSPSATNIWQSVLDAPSHVDFVHSIIDPQTALRNLSRLDNSNTTSPKKDSLDWMDALPNSFTCIKYILKFVTEEFRAESSNQNFQRNLDDLGLSDQRHGLPGYLKRQYEKEVLEFETRILDTILLQSKGLHREIVACAGKISTCTYQLSHFELCGSQRILDKCRQAVEQLETRLQDAKDYAEEMRRQNLVADLVLAKEIASKVGVQDHLTPFRIKWAPNQGTTGPCRCEFASAVTGTQLSVLTDTQFEVNDVRVETSPTFQIFRSVPSDSTAARLYEALAQEHANVFSRSNGKAMWDAIDILEHIGIFQQRLNQVVLEVYAISQVYQVTMKSVGNRHMISVELPGTASIHIVYLSTHPRCIAYSLPSAIRVLRNGDVVDRLPKIFALAVSECSVELCGRLLQRLCDSQSVVV